jgi:hypothetical protein
VGAQTLTGAMNLLFNSQSLWTSAGTAVSYSVAGMSMNGTLTVSGTVNSYALTVVFSNYVDVGTGYTMNGTGDFTADVDTSLGSGSGGIAGSFTFSGGVVAAQTWDVTMSGFGSTSSYSGTVTCNGTKFNAADLSLEKAGQANSAFQAVFFGFGQVLGNQSSWVPGTGDNVSYSVPGIDMTGTKTSGPNTSDYVLSIKFTSYVDTQFGYTLNGTVDFALSATNTPNAITGGSLSGTVTLTGSVFSGITFNVATITGVPGMSMFFTGKVTVGGTTFDAKIFVPG